MTSPPKKFWHMLKGLCPLCKKYVDTLERDAFQVFIVWPHCISLLSSSSSTSWGATLLYLRLCFWILHNLSRDLFSIKTKSQVNVVVFQMNVTFRNNFFLDTPPKFTSSPLKSYRTPIGKDRLPFPPFFRWRLLLVSGRPPSLGVSGGLKMKF